MNVVKVRRCERCHQVHDCQFYSEMKVLQKRMDKEIERLIGYVKACERAGFSTPEIHPLEDK